MSTEDERKLFVAGLPDSITEEVLRQIFEATGGTVVDVSLPRHRDTGRPRGFGFVTLSSAEEAASARSSLDGSMQAGRSISVRPFQSEPRAARAGQAVAEARAIADPRHRAAAAVVRTARSMSAICRMTPRRRTWSRCSVKQVRGPSCASIYPRVQMVARGASASSPWAAPRPPTAPSSRCGTRISKADG